MSLSSSDKIAGFYADLEKLLKQQLAATPGATDLQMKLLELYFETGSRNDFISEASRFARGIKDRAASRDWQKIASMGRTLAADDPLFKVSDTGKLEFVEAPAHAPAAKAHKRFGDDPRSQRHFKELATAWE